jgi:hypothetical protein
MIEQVFQSGRYIMVSNGGSSHTYVNNSGYMGVGQLQYNTNTQQFEVYNGISWQKLNTSTAHVGLSQDAEQILDWAKNKMREEEELERLAKDNVAIRDLVNQINEKKDQIKMVQTLIRKEVTV